LLINTAPYTKKGRRTRRGKVLKSTTTDNKRDKSERDGGGEEGIFFTLNTILVV
jgi:hypothetical protein